MSSLSHLHVELLLSILQCLSSPKDLYSAIGATSQFYRIFTTYRRSILSAVLLRAIPPQVEADFLLAYRAQRIWDFALERQHDNHLTRIPRRDYGKKLEILSQETTAILKAAESGKSEELHNFVSDSESLTKLWGFYQKFEDLITLYAKKALSNLQQTSGASNDTPESLRLSSDEKVRLQRAFFRWEVYTCLFQISQLTHHDDRHPAPSDDPAPAYATIFQPWEIEEICCICQFSRTLIEEVCDELEEDFVTTVKAKEAACHPPSEPDVIERDLSSNLDYYCLWWYDESFKRCDRAKHVAYLVARGMLSMWKLKHAPFQTVRSMIVRSQFEHKDRISIIQGLEELCYEEYEIDESSEDCNLGWQWAVTVTEGWGPYAPANYALRSQGYVFWDQARLEREIQFQSPRCPIKSLYEFPPGYQAHERLPGVETKLKDLQVRSEVIKEIADEVGGIDDDTDVIDWRN